MINFRKTVLKELHQGTIDKVEAKTLIISKRIIKLDLSMEGKEDPVCFIIERIPELKPYFTNIISLGHGEKP